MRLAAENKDHQLGVSLLGPSQWPPSWGSRVREAWSCSQRSSPCDGESDAAEVRGAVQRRERREQT